MKHTGKVAELDALLARILGTESAPGRCSVTLARGVGTGAGAGAGAGAASGVASRVHRFLFIADGKVRGAAVVEPAREAYPLVLLAPGGGSDAGAAAGREGGTCDGSVIEGKGAGAHRGAPAPLPDVSTMRLADSPVGVSLGVAQVWVHPSHRRSGVGSALLDAAREHAVYAYTVPKAELAFSQPTSDGYALAATYLGTARVPVY